MSTIVDIDESLTEIGDVFVRKTRPTVAAFFTS